MKVSLRVITVLIVPIAGPVIGWAVDPWAQAQAWAERKADPSGNVGDIDEVRYPHIVFREKVSLPKPYKTIHQMNMPVARW